MSSTVSPRVPASPGGAASSGRAPVRPSGPRGGTERSGSRALRLAALAAGAAVLLFWWVDSPAATFTTPAGTLTSAGELAGLVASVLVCAQVLLVARVPWFERAVGLDRLVSWHRSLGTTFVLLLASHVVLLVWGQGLATHAGPWSSFWALYDVTPDILRALLGSLGFVVVALTSSRLLRRYLSYEWWYLVHLGTYVCVYLTFGHQVHGGTHLAPSPAAQAVWWAMYLATAASVVLWRVLIPFGRQVTGLARVERVVPEADGVTSVWLRGRSVARLQAVAGQFVVVRFLARGHLASAHPYSVSTVPDGGRLRLTIGALGDHSSAAAALRPGTRVVLEGPYGRFTADRARHHGVLLVAGGVGVGPVRALAEELWRRGHDVVVLHRARSAAALALAGELDAAPDLRYVALVGRRAELGHDPLSGPSILAAVPDVARRDVFVCGPPAMCDAVSRAVRSLGVPRSAVHHDELSF